MTGRDAGAGGSGLTLRGGRYASAGSAAALVGEGRPAGAAEIDEVAGVLSATQGTVVAGNIDAVQQGVAPSLSFAKTCPVDKRLIFWL